MAKKQEKEIERWVTVNGARVPIFKDVSIGGPKELRDKLKASKDKKSTDTKENGKAHTKFGQEFQDKADKYREKFLTKRSDAEIAELKKNLDKSTSLTGTSQNDHVAYKAIEDEMKRREQSKSTTTSNIIKANDDLKEKQIARNEAEKAAINGKKSTKPKSYAERIVASLEARDNSFEERLKRGEVKNTFTKYENESSHDREMAKAAKEADKAARERHEAKKATDKKVNPSTKSAKDSYKKLDKPHDVIIERRGEQMQVKSYGEGWEEGYHVEHTDDVGGKFIDKGKVGNYKIGEQVNYLDGNKMKSGTITMAHKYRNGNVDYNVADAKGDGHNVSSNNLAKTDAEKATKAKPTISPREKANSMTEAQLRAMVKKAGLTKQYNMMMNTRPGAYGYSKQLQVLRDLIADYLAVKENKKKR